MQQALFQELKWLEPLKLKKHLKIMLTFVEKDEGIIENISACILIIYVKL